MKRRELVKLLEDNGWYIREMVETMTYIRMVIGANPFRDIQISNEKLARNIIKKLGLK